MEASSRFLALPAEIRQQILLHALPESIHINPDAPSPLGDLQRICKQINQDLEAISTQYEATYILTIPEHLTCIRPLKHGINQIKHISLHLFSSFQVKDLLDRATSIMWDSPVADVLARWMRHTHPSTTKLPRRGLKTLDLDITPVPGYVRNRSPAWIAWLVNHTSVSNRLWNMHEIFIADMITNLGSFFSITSNLQQPLLRVRGTISPKTRTRIPTVFQRLEAFPRIGGIDAVFESDYVEDASNLRWEAILEILQTEYETTSPGPLRDSRRIVKDRLRAAFQDDEPFRSLFNRNALQLPTWTRDTTLDIAAVAAGGGSAQSLRLERLGPLQRAYIHQLAEHWRLSSFSEEVHGPGGDQKAVVVLNKMAGRWNVEPWGAGPSARGYLGHTSAVV